MSTIKVTNLQNASAASPAIVLDANSRATLNGLSYPTEGSLSGRNRIINGSMTVDQRNAGASVTHSGGSNLYVLDRWVCNSNGTPQFSVQRVADAPAGFVNSSKLTTTTSGTPAAGDFSYYGQYIEGFNVSDLAWGTASAKAITVSFWVKSSLNGAFGGAVKNNDVNRAYPFSYSISSANTWEYKTVTIPGDTAGTWLTDSGIGMILFFDTGSGTNNKGTAGAWNSTTNVGVTGSVNLVATASATWQITGVQLEAGSVATPFERRSYGQELALCQRYAYVIRGQGVGSVAPHGSAAQTVTLFFIIPFPVQMRAAPAFTLSGAASNFTVSDGNAGTDVSAISLNDGSPYSGRLNFTPVSGVTQFRPYMIETDNANSALIFSAEL